MFLNKIFCLKNNNLFKMEYKNPKLTVVVPKTNSKTFVKSKHVENLENLCSFFHETTQINDTNFDKFLIYVIDKSYKLKLQLHSQKKAILEYITYIIVKLNINSKHIKFRINHTLDELIFDILLLNKRKRGKCCC